ncbi:hypothetical protein OIU78_011232 [Salix suchowensis]|nr:hypothetical protein OIU78_011232 [Salix suchowensis]
MERAACPRFDELCLGQENCHCRDHPKPANPTTPEKLEIASSALKIIHGGGRVECYYMAIPAARILEKYPSHALAKPEVFRSPWNSVVRPEKIPTPGQDSLPVPHHTVKKLRRKARNHHPRQFLLLQKLQTTPRLTWWVPFTHGPPPPTKTAPLFDNHAGTDGALFNDVFGGPPQYSVSRGGASTTALSFDHDSIFKEQNSKSASLPIFDKPVYDDDIFDGLPGLKSSSSDGGSASAPKFDDAFRSVSSPPKQQQHGRPVRDSSPFDDLLGNLGKKETESKRERGRVDKDSAAFDDLLPGFGRPSSPAVNRYWFYYYFLLLFL